MDKYKGGIRVCVCVCNCMWAFYIYNLKVILYSCASMSNKYIHITDCMMRIIYIYISNCIPIDIYLYIKNIYVWLD
jgi:hypothetical protein